MKKQHIDTYIYVKAVKKHNKQVDVIDIIKGKSG